MAKEMSVYERLTGGSAPALSINALPGTAGTPSASANESESKRSSGGSRPSRDCARPGIEAKRESDGCSPSRRPPTIWCACEILRKLRPKPLESRPHTITGTSTVPKSLTKPHARQTDQYASLVFPQPASRLELAVDLNYIAVVQANGSKQPPVGPVLKGLAQMAVVIGYYQAGCRRPQHLEHFLLLGAHGN